MPERPSSACSSSTLKGRLRTAAPGAYLPAVSASGTCAYRRAARAARRPDLMDKPSLQTSQAIAGLCRTATPTPLSAVSYARCSSFPQGQDDPMTANQPKGFGGSPAYGMSPTSLSVKYGSRISGTRSLRSFRDLVFVLEIEFPLQSCGLNDENTSHRSIASSVYRLK